MYTLSRERAFELFLFCALTLYAVAYAFASPAAIYGLLTLSLLVTFCSIVWLYFTISIGKFILSRLLNFARICLQLPFKVIRRLPRLIRQIFFETPIIIIFFLWFRFLVFFDRAFIRRILRWAGGLKHESGIRISTVNAISPSFVPLNKLNSGVGSFDLSTAVSLANLSKLAYEDEGVIRYELEKAGFVASHFQTIQYHNTTGYVCVLKDVVVIAFRGTEPLNLMHILTDLQGGLVSLSSLDEKERQTDVDAGKAHYGFLEALRLSRSDTPGKSDSGKSTPSKKTIALDEEDSIGSTFTALFKLAGFLFGVMAKQPLAIKLPRANGKITAFEQVATALERIQDEVEIKRIYCTGHSLGAALATVFYAQAHLSNLPVNLTRRMFVYSFGSPRLGDSRFTEWMNETGASKHVFKIVNAQDLVPRMPVLPQHLPKRLRRFPYAEGPGTLVHLNPLAEGSDSLEERPGIQIDSDGNVPPIVFWGLSGLLSLNTIKKIRRERWLWITARFWIPFVMFDHLASQYAVTLEDLYAGSDEGHFESQMRVKES